MVRELDFNKHSVTEFLSGLKEMFFEDVTDRSREFVKQLLEWGLKREFEEYVEAIDAMSAFQAMVATGAHLPELRPGNSSSQRRWKVSTSLFHVGLAGGIRTWFTPRKRSIASLAAAQPYP